MSDKDDTYTKDLVDLNQMNRIMRHRLRNLCCGMKMAIDRISEQTAKDYPAIGDSCSIMGDELDNLERFTHRMDLLFDKLPASEPQAFYHVILSARQYFIQNFPFLDIIMDGPESDAILLHGSWIMIALEELILNAGESSSEEESVSVTWTFGEKTYIKIKNLDEDKLPEEIPFDPPQPFFTIRGRHDGLGLSIVNRICMKIGAKFECKQDSNGYVSAIIELPSEELT
ncbi:MAG: HAMP domain-containing histidine kinase [Lentisphaeria bacterium]|nr:hypothetical protein [Lentisphaeria bacterium]NQZ68708.1 HAMP domain-containing histidine kinase [Lentisphaeria bacterium]